MNEIKQKLRSNIALPMHGWSASLTMSAMHWIKSKWNWWHFERYTSIASRNSLSICIFNPLEKAIQNTCLISIFRLWKLWIGTSVQYSVVEKNVNFMPFAVVIERGGGNIM